MKGKTGEMKKRELIVVKDLRIRKRGKTIIEGLGFSVSEGELLYIIGPNGGGKTTLLRAILGIENYEGKIEVKVDKEKIGYVPQAKTFERDFPMSIEEAVTYFNEYDGREEMKMFGLYEIRHKILSELSGGQLQRVFLARAFVNDPSLIVMDEPDTSLDSNWRERLYSIITKKNREGKTVIMATHDLTVMENKVDKILCLNKSIHIHGNEEILTRENLEKVYGCPVEFIGHEKISHRTLRGHKNE